MFNRVKGVTKSLGKILTGTAATAIVLGSISGAVATAKINNDVNTATILSMGDKVLAKQLVNESFGNSLATQISSVYASVLSNKSISPLDAVDNLIEKTNINYWENVSNSLSYSNYKTSDLSKVFDNLYENRVDIAEITNESLMFDTSNKVDKEQMFINFMKNYNQTLSINSSALKTDVVLDIADSISLADAKTEIVEHQKKMNVESSQQIKIKGI